MRLCGLCGHRTRRGFGPLDERVHELGLLEDRLEEREAELERRDAERRVAIELEEEALAVREQELNELAIRLTRKESQVADYVAKVQKQLGQATSTTTAASSEGAGWRRRRTRSDRT